ncbi:MAG TPA: AsmA-like C-terminal region-containing protein [Vicinamibacteria bacterium]|nr:AsmA-like C-terminal region-containing protein [Vicinamibacteria bacterium]
MFEKVRDYKAIWKGLAIAALALVLLGLLGPFVFVRLLRHKAREKAVALLEKRFDHVELERLEISMHPGFSILPLLSAAGEGLSISLPGREMEPPFVTITDFAVELSLLGLVRDPIRIKSLQLDELQIQIPPKREGDSAGPESESGDERLPVFLIEKLVADGTLLRILPDDPVKAPLDFDLHQLEVASAGLGEPMHFEALLTNPKPPGDIDTEGDFGPLLLSDPGASPVSGTYVFENADLGVFRGISGILRSEGRFDGVLGRIEVTGFTETPDFRLKSAGNPVPLRTAFQAIVDGTKGDTFLVPVEATLEKSRFRTEGGVSERPGTEGKTVCVDAEGTGGRIEDFLRLAMKSEKPFMTGDVRFRSLVMIPPGEVDVAQKLILDGEFVIDSALFPEREVQEKVDMLSNAGRGINEGDPAAPLREERVFSDMRGSFRLENGVLSVSHMSFHVPGAAVRLRGTYRLQSEEIDFHGELHLKSKLSETTTGIKSFLLKLIDQLFSDDGAGTVVPITISGKADDPSFGVAVSRALSGKDMAPQPESTEEWTKSIPSCVELLALSPDAFEATQRLSSAVERFGVKISGFRARPGPLLPRARVRQESEEAGSSSRSPS